MDSRNNQPVRKLLQQPKGRDDADLVWLIIVQTHKKTVIMGYLGVWGVTRTADG